MVDDVPVVGAGNVDDGVMAGAIDAVGGILDDDDGLRGNLDGTGGRGGGAVGHVVVGRAGVVDRPEEVVESVAIEHVGALAVGVVGEGTARGCDDVFVAAHRHHVVGEQSVAETSVAIVEIGLAGNGVGEHVGVDHLARC